MAIMAKSVMGQKKFKIGIVVGEASGDQLGSELIKACRSLTSIDLEFVGLAGEKMSGDGVSSLFPIDEISVMGITAVIPKIPIIIKRINQTVAYLVEEDVQGLVIIDSPDFTQRVAKKFHKIKPDVKIIGYVSPSVWAWRSGRAKAMSKYISHLMALLPFEPDVHRRLGGPPCSYVGHPLLERLNEPIDRDRYEPNTLILLPGSRRQEITAHLPFMFEVIRRLEKDHGIKPKIVLPTQEKRKAQITSYLDDESLNITLISGENEKWDMFEAGHAALAVSGTVTLELAVKRVPTVVIYRLSFIEARLRFLVAHLKSIVLANLVADHCIYPEFVERTLPAHKVANEIAKIWPEHSVERLQQRKYLMDLKSLMANEKGSPAERAAKCLCSIFDIFSDKGAS